MNQQISKNMDIKIFMHNINLRIGFSTALTALPVVTYTSFFIDVVNTHRDLRDISTMVHFDRLWIRNVYSTRGPFFH